VWMTEKFLGAFMAGTVTVFLGWTGAKDYAPHNKSMIFSSDFASYKDLADYLTYLANHEEAYYEYFEWRNLPVEQLNPHFLAMWNYNRRYSCFCRLCNVVAQYAIDKNSLGDRRRTLNRKQGYVPFANNSSSKT